MLETVDSKHLDTEEAVRGEDLLLTQIDAFREKAKQLQSLVVSKERRVKELEAQVKAKETRNAELQQELAVKQAEAENIAKGVEDKIGTMMADLQEGLTKQVADSQEQTNQQLASQIGEHLAPVQEALSSSSTDIDDVKGDLSDKIHNESVTLYRNLQDLLNEMDNSGEQMADITAKIKALRMQMAVLSVVNILLSGGVLAVLLLLLVF